MEYFTKNKKSVMDVLIANKDKHLTIEEIASLLEQNGTPVAKASLYRIIDSLLSQGLLRKYSIDSNSSSCYQYSRDLEHNHIHLICERCGKIIHLECHEVNKLLSHINMEHGFDINLCKVNLYGVCKECRGK